MTDAAYRQMLEAEHRRQIAEAFGFADTLRAEVERLRAALVEERADNVEGHWGGPQTREHALIKAREMLRAEGLLPPD
jgi:hypothetical protein